MMEGMTTVTLTEDQCEELERIATAESKTLAEIVHEALDEYCKEQGVS